VYTGALENRPELVDRLAARRRLWGNAGDALRAARDPMRVAGALRAAGLPAPEVRLDPAGLPRDGSWLCKARASSGGRHVVAFTVSEDRPRRRPVYYQERVEGLSLSAVFVAARGGAALAGVTRQLLGLPGAPFAYRGGVGPWPVADATARALDALGHCLAAGLGLVGLFGVDFILGGDGLVWPVEVNPRYTAAVELIELAVGRPLLDDHRRACGGLPVDTAARPARCVAKEVLYADRGGVFAAEPDGLSDPDLPFRVPRVADVPARRTPVGAGEPVLTVFGAGPTPEEALGRLRAAREDWERRWCS
jgi:predicted ATP-grasp superfamily ATP-dependent carboligase